MKKILLKQLLTLVATVFSLSLMGQSPVAERIGNGVSAVKTPLSPSDVRFTKPVSFTGNSGLRSAITPSLTPSPTHSPLSVMSAAGSKINMMGTVVYSQSQPNGFYTIPTESVNTLDPLNNTYSALPENCFGAVALDGVYYVAWQYDFFGMMLINYIDSYDMNTWTRLDHKEVKSQAMFATDVSLDPVSGKVFGCYINDSGDGYVFGMADYVNCTRTAIAPLTTAWNSVAFDKKGQLYAIDMNGDLLAVDNGTGSTTKIGSTGVTPKYQSSAVIDPKSDRMFWSVFGEDEVGNFYEVDKTTGKATLLYKFPGNEEVCGLVVIAPEAEDYAPAAVSELSLNFSNGSLSGTVDFTAPTTYFCGETPADGAKMAYRVLANGEEVSKGTCGYGEKVKADVTLTTAGKYEISVAVSNDEGSSPFVKTEGFIGSDTPVATKATLTRKDDKLILTWTPVKESVNGGYIDINKISYTVTRYPEAAVVAKNIPDTTFTEAVPAGDDLVSYYYTVIAHAGELSSGVATSNTVTTGSILPPYTSTFNKSTGLDGYTTINANDDDKVWQLKNGAAYLPYNKSLDSDDWLITPPIRLKAGNTYKVNYVLYTESGSYKEKVEVKWGSEATAEGMTDILLEPYEFSSLADVPFEAYITPKADGTYYIGFHGISAKYMYGLFVGKISISEGTNLGSPGASTDLAIIPDFNGENKATVKFKAPAVDVKGDQLQSLTSVELKRDDVLIHTFNTPAPGAELTFVDEVEKSGTYTYTITGFNTFGSGKSVSTSAFIGINKPGKVSNLVAFETSTPGEVTFQWDSATTDADGNPMNPDLITYSIFEFTTQSKYVPVVEGLKTTTYTFLAVPADGEQEMKQWVVCAATQSGLGSPVATEMLCVGPNYQLPFVESVANGQLSYNFTIDQQNGGVWRLYTSKTLTEPAAVDGDDGLFGMKGNGVGTYGSLISGKIEISGAKPTLSFYTFNIDGVNPSTGENIPDDNILNVYVRDGKNETQLKNIVISSLPAKDWNLVTIPFTDYKGKVVYIRFEGVSVKYDYVLVDNIRLTDAVDNDLTIATVGAPTSVKAGEEFNVDVVVENLGLATSGSFTVNLLRDGKTVAKADSTGLASGLNAIFSFPQTVTVVDGEVVEFTAEVLYDKDERVANNLSDKPVAVATIFPSYPTPTHLLATSKNNVVSLSWVAPEVDNSSASAVTETFEGADSFATAFEGWTFIDVDQKAIGGLSGIKFPGIATYSKQSFFVLDNSDDQFNSTFGTRSGNKCLVSMCEAYFQGIDDWAISPKLSGKAQTVSVYARSYDNRYPETIELLYSTGSLQPSDFVSVAKFERLSNEWTEYKAELPEGARYFAIRSCAVGGSMLMVDDVTYVPAPEFEGLELLGYNVYRNGTKLNDTLVSETAMNDNFSEQGEHVYAVSAVYNEGESRAVKTTVCITTGVDSVIAEDDSEAVYFNLQGIRVDKPVHGNIYIRQQGSKTEKIKF